MTRSCWMAMHHNESAPALVIVRKSSYKIIINLHQGANTPRGGCSLLRSSDLVSNRGARGPMPSGLAFIVERRVRTSTTLPLSPFITQHARNTLQTASASYIIRSMVLVVVLIMLYYRKLATITITITYRSHFATASAIAASSNSPGWTANVPPPPPPPPGAPAAAAIA